MARCRDGQETGFPVPGTFSGIEMNDLTSHFETAKFILKRLKAMAPFLFVFLGVMSHRSRGLSDRRMERDGVQQAGDENVQLTIGNGTHPMIWG